MSFGETRMETEAAQRGASNLIATGESLKSREQALRARIEAIHAAQPWGDDAAGRNFRSWYLEGASPAPAMLETGTSIANRLVTMGDDVDASVRAVVATDEAAARAFEIP